MKTTAANCSRLTALLLLSALLQACATRSPSSTPTICPPPPQIPALPPSLSEPPPPESFLDAARNDAQTWQDRLTGSATRSPASKPSP